MISKGEWTTNGALRIIDRKKHIFKMQQGEYIAPERLEVIFEKSPFIDQVFVYGNSLREYLVALLGNLIRNALFYFLNKYLKRSTKVNLKRVSIMTRNYSSHI